ncbi:hypothetical protein IWX48DRAFT_659534 [Phyllosticta citricarpa]
MMSCISHLKAIAALEKAQNQDDKYSWYDDLFTFGPDRVRVRNLFNEIKGMKSTPDKKENGDLTCMPWAGYVREIHSGGKIEISFDTKHRYGRMTHNNERYQGGIVTYTGRVTWISFNTARASFVRVSLYRASEDGPDGFRSKWCNHLPIETKKRILEDLLTQVELATSRFVGEYYKGRVMQKHTDMSFINQLPRPPLGKGTEHLKIMDGGQNDDVANRLGLEDPEQDTWDASDEKHQMFEGKEPRQAHGQSTAPRGPKVVDNGHGNTYYIGHH